jgi:transglutaminase-like putative cysteine protease
VIFSVRHITTFRYNPAVRESVMEVRLQPRSDVRQHCLSFQLDVDPRAAIMQYRDFLGNTVHHFDIAGSHSELKIVAQAAVDVQPISLPQPAAAGRWDELDAAVATEDHWEMLLPSHFARPSPPLDELAKELGCERRGTPMELLTELNESLYRRFAYVPNSTKVDSPIDEALQNRKGVCQDFAHILIALARQLGVPCRYISGYLSHAPKRQDRSAEGASHAWVEAFLPGAGWISFDPTNNLIGADRHIRVAIGRDYADVPPTRGVYKGDSESELHVAVAVSRSDQPFPEEMPPGVVLRSSPGMVQIRPRPAYEQQQQQQQ